MLLWHSPALYSGDHTVYARTLTNALLRVRGLRVWPFIHIYVVVCLFLLLSRHVSHTLLASEDSSPFLE